MWLHSLLLSLALRCCSAAEPPGPPSIYLNSSFLQNQSEVVLTAGSAFRLGCHGNGSVHWSTNAILPMYKDKRLNPLQVSKADPKQTGTYQCSYTNQEVGHLNTWIHLYIKDPADPSTVFVTPRRSPSLKEGDDFLFRCLLTDPSIMNLTFQSEVRGRGLPPGMNVTFDLRRGVLIRQLRRSFKGQYTCSGWRDGQEFRSKPVNLLIHPRLHHPPSLSISQVEVLRLEGELFEVTCQAGNPSHFFSVSWTHPHIQGLKSTTSQYYDNICLYINNTLTISAVSRNHSGPYTCTAVNEAGVSMATAHLRVLDHPYLRIYLYLQTTDTLHITESLFANASSMLEEKQEEPEANISSSTQEVKGDLIANISTNRTDMNGGSRGNVRGHSRVDVYEGGDMTLTFFLEAYPPIHRHYWMTPSQLNNNDAAVFEKSYSADGYKLKVILLLRRVRQEDRGRYSFDFCNSFFNGSHEVDLRIYRSPTAAIIQQNNSLICISSGYPRPTVLWLTCTSMDKCENSIYQAPLTSVTSQEGEEVRVHLPLSRDDDVTVMCVTYNLVGQSRQVFVHRPTGLHTIFTPPLIGALSAAAILLLLLLVVFYKCRQKPKYEIRWKIIESTDGNNYTFVDPTQLPYNQKWEFPRDKLRLGPVLGSGAFGKVVEATAYGLGTDNKATRVAVKMLKPSAHSEEREALMSELKILSHLGYHDNIVNLLGACTQGGPMLMITEYCSHGDLLNFLRAHAQDFMVSMMSVDKVEDEEYYKNMAAQNTRLRSDSGISCWSEYQEMQPVLSPGQTNPSEHMDSLSVFDLMRFSCQVAQGLDFLSFRNCIHRDVAARNVLLTDRRVAKICDFGLARDIRNDDSYIVQGNARLPVKWMAPESIFQCVYTVQSDVWSYGVLLWEIFSLGKSPYPNVAVDTNFYKMIKDGRHMEQPDFSPNEMYHLMKLCWSLEPTHRPTFKMIGQLINRLLPSTNEMLPHHSDQVKKMKV
uniref:receptor protein-tyrosine kinase n=1 Tax=Kryptolebias marmoratus TaxID=37003 RepID=A0A3Q3AME9_KRYMA